VLVYFECSNAPLSETIDVVLHWHLAECHECNEFLKELKENALSEV
jgi:hypothetical protein